MTKPNPNTDEPPSFRGRIEDNPQIAAMVRSLVAEQARDSTIAAKVTAAFALSPALSPSSVKRFRARHGGEAAGKLDLETRIDLAETDPAELVRRTYGDDDEQMPLEAWLDTIRRALGVPAEDYARGVGKSASVLRTTWPAALVADLDALTKAWATKKRGAR